ALVLLERARLALERDFFGSVPRHDRLRSLEKPPQLRRAEIGGRTATEVDELQRPAANHRQLAVKFYLLHESIEIRFYITGVFVRIDAEIAKLAALAAERDVQIEPQRRVRIRRRLQSGPCRRQVLPLPKRERRVV